MCEQLGQVREAMGRYAAGFDASLLSCDDAAAVVLAAAAIENLAATVKALAASRSAAGEGWKAAGARSAVVTRGQKVVGVAHLGRRANAHQQTALEWLYPSCAAEGCSSVAWLENDHRVDWAASHTTVLDLLDRLCSHHHDLKTIDNWALVDGRAKRAFVPPDDPRHPRQAGRAA